MNHAELGNMAPVMVGALVESRSHMWARPWRWQTRSARLARSLAVLLEGDSDSPVRRREGSAIGQLGDVSTKKLSATMEALDDSDWTVRQWAARRLGQLGNMSTDVVSALLTALDDSSERVSQAAASSLVQLGHMSTDVVSVLVAALDDSSEMVRQAAARSLVQLVQMSGNVVSALAVVLGDSFRQVGPGALYQSSVLVRQAAASGLGEAPGEVVAALVEALGDRDFRVRSAAAGNLGQVKLEDEAQLRTILIALNRRLHDRDDDVRRAALTAIRQLLDGRQIPGYRWVPIRDQQRRRRRRRLLDMGVLGIGLVVLAALAVGIGSGQMELSAGWVQVAGGLALLAVLAGGWDLFWSYRRRPPWDQ